MSGNKLQRNRLNQTPDRPAGFTDFLQLAAIFTFQFRDAKVQPSLLLLHSPSLRLTMHIPSRSEVAERVSRLPLRCPVWACVTMPSLVYDISHRLRMKLEVA